METVRILSHTKDAFHKISCHVWGAGGDSPNVPVVCVHGLTRNGRDFDKLAAHLSQTRRVFCPDMPGRAQSDDLPNVSDYCLEQYVCDGTAVIARTGASQVDWVGTSMGGLIGMMMAGKEGSPIRRLVLNDVGPAIAAEALHNIGNYLEKTPETFASTDEIESFLRTTYAAWGALTNEDWRGMAESTQRRGKDGRLVIGYDRKIAKAFQEVAEGINLWSIYDRIKCPTLLLRGKDSPLLTPDVAEEMTKRGPCAKMVEIEGCGHAPSLMTAEQIELVSHFLMG